MASSRPGSKQIDTSQPVKPKSNIPNLIRFFAVVSVVGVLIGLAGIFVPKFTANGAQNVSSQRERVVTTATDFAVAYNTYNVTNTADYQERMSGLLSKSYRAEFDKITSEIFKLLVPKKQVSNNAKVLGVAIDSFDKDSAVVLVAVDATLTNTDSKDPVARHMRWRLSMVKQNGKWLVDKLASVATAEASTGTPSATPTEGSKAK